MDKNSNQFQQKYPSNDPTSRLSWLWLSVLIPLLLLSSCNLPQTNNFLQHQVLFPLQGTLVAIQQTNQPDSTPISTLVQDNSSLPTTPSNQYQPSAEILQLVNQAAMTARARNIFYSTQPQIDTDRLTFERHCQTQVMKNTVELGCFTNENRIYLLKLDDPHISEEMVVTASHEMLHAAYSLLSTSDQTRINGLIETAIKGIHDPDLLQRMKAYRVLEPGERDNELHSILGTEYPGLGSDLEQYYSLYFSDGRQAVVTAAQQFNRIFSQQESQLTSLQTQIIQTRRQMQTDLARHKIAAYNQLIPQFNGLVKQYNQAVKGYNGLSRALLGEEIPASNQ